MIGGRTEHIVNRCRLEGFGKAHKDCGILPDESLVITGSSEPAKVIAALDKLLKKHPDCIVCTDDSVCTTVLNRLAALGVSIPQDIGVASFYNSTTLDNHRPSVTSLEFDAVEAGTIAFEVLMDRIDGKDVKERTLLGYNIMERESTRRTAK